MGRFHTGDALFVKIQNLSKLTDRQLDKVRRIVHPKLKPFHFQIRRIIGLTRIIQRITRLRRMIRL